MSRIKGAKYSFALQDGTWEFSGDAVAGKGLILRLYFYSPLSAASPLEHKLHEAESFFGYARGMQGLGSRTRD